VAEDLYDYTAMVETALRGVVREALTRAGKNGLRGGHHFYITFRTAAPGVELPDYLRQQYPDEMTIVLQHQFWHLTVEEAGFSVGLSFQSKLERLSVPFAAVTGFADPSVKFGLQFQAAAPPPAEIAGLPAAPPPAAEPSPEAKTEPTERPAAEIVTLDKFRKR
jgi:hypothetical protein